MPNSRIITLLSDFGLSDVYVGVMKGVISSLNPTLTVVDLTHQIPAQNIPAGRFCLMNSYSYFPPGTVHIAVVDPGVGSNRRSVAVEFEGGFLVAPDNGLLSGVLSQSAVKTAVELTNPQYWRTSTPSTTFHGRDIFAPVGAHLASGVPLEELGKIIDPKTLIQLPIGECSQTDQGMTGYVQYVDYFGNLITNIPGADVQGKAWSVVVSDVSIPGCTTYHDQPAGSAIALIGSHGWVEIAVNCGNAQSQLKINWGDKIEIINN
ncbi:protein of unknown function DUF62 [Crinalium epipsammum PCC 9333]|uniref:SAM-dependent chlorinase/fluorinase n=1 Tax=Crinalium epipsammum PCC 9333 TaxID=1173022 RepID=K9VYC3_9CYAN|nr:SAM-dependent chlorinase/fluorinase [Crinalium epipsammum]AFZ12150.1 protein of unknown function DUF62 [Crinalium epipsammum PCC 9333]